MRLLIAIIALAAALPSGARAAMDIPVSLLAPDTTMTGRMSAARSHASAEAQGRGDRLVLSYTTKEGSDLFIFPVRADGSPDAANALTARLPAGVSQEVSLDLALAPTWSPGFQRYRVHALSPGATAPILHSLSVARSTTPLSMLAVRQLMYPEVWQPSSYHRLRGYRMLGQPFALIAGLLVVTTGLIVLVLRRKRGEAFLLFLVAGFLLYGARVSMDLTSMSMSHLRTWAAQGIYAQAGAAYAAADLLRAEEPRPGAPLSVFVCHDGTSYLPTLLRYLLFPAVVSDVPDPGTTHVVLMQKVRWSEGPDVLRCDGLAIPARRLRAFPDGSVLYERLPS